MSVETQRSEYYERVARAHMTPLWTIMSEAVPEAPRPKFAPHKWDFSHDIRPALIEAADLISAEEAERRVLVLNNPSLPRGATHTLFCAMQLVKGGEIAPPHRHTQSALRLVFEGTGAYTAVNGERTQMSRGDFIVTPPWSWHEHGKETDGPMIWLDGLDIPIVNHLGATFCESPEGAPDIPAVPAGLSLARYGSGLLPVEAPRGSLHSPLFRYPYEQARAAVTALAQSAPLDTSHGARMKYSNPLTGDFVLPTIAAYLQALPPGFRGVPYRSTEAKVLVVLEGSGAISVGDATFALQPNDIVAIPNWTWHGIQANEDMIAFSYSDRAVLEKVGLFREERAGQ